jgi:hypothetical protein
MGCVINLKQDVIPSLPNNGFWVYQGYNVSSDVGPWGVNPLSPLFSFSPGTVVNTPNIQLNTEGKSAGYYGFDYVYGSEATRIVVSVIEDSITAGVSKSINLSETSSPINLLTQLGASSGGIWTDVDNVGSSFSNGTLDPDGLPSGVYRFRYDLTDQNETVDTCTDCPSLISEISVNITPGITGNITLSTESATYTLELVHPDSSTLNRAKFVLLSDNLTWQVLARKLVKRNSVTIEDTIVNLHATAPLTSTFSSAPVLWLGRRIESFAALQPTGFIQYVTLVDSVTNTASVTVPLAPSGTYQAVFSGPAGTVTADDLTFNGTNGPQMAAAIIVAFKNYMSTISAVEGTHYYFTLENSILGTSPPSKFYTAVKHTPASLWYGISGIAFKRNSSAINTTSSQEVNAFTWWELPVRFGQGCPYLSYDPSFAAYIFNGNRFTFSFTNFSELTPVVISEKPTSFVSTVCTEDILTVSVQGCTGSLSYLWSTGSTTASTLALLPGLYTVTCTCTNPAQTITLSYVKT